MKVMMVHVRYRKPGGEDAVFENECLLLRDAGINVIREIFTNEVLNENGLINQIKMGLNSVWSFSTYKMLKSKLKKHRPDVVHFHNIFPLLSPSVYTACRSERIPIIQTLHNYRLICPGALLFRDDKVCEDCLKKGLSQALRYSCYRDSVMATAAVFIMLKTNNLFGSYDKVSKFIALTNFAMEKYVAGGIPRDRIIVKPNFLPNPPKPNYKVGDYILYVGRLSKEKGVGTLLEALTHIEKPIKLRIAGDGPMLPELKSFSLKKEIEIEFLGFMDKETLLDQIRNSAFLVVPSEWYEGFPMVLLEAYACGKPVVASRIGSLNELVAEDETGMKFVPGDPIGLAKVITEMLSNLDRIGEMGKNAHAVFKEKYSSESNLNALNKIYTNLVSNSHSKRNDFINE